MVSWGDDMDIEKLIALIKTYNAEEENIIRKAYEYARLMHAGQRRQSGEPYIIHPLNVAYILAQMKADRDTICAGLLHDTLEDTKATKEEISNLFNPCVSELVDGVTKLSKMNFSSKKEEVCANTKKIISGITEDIRIIIIKLADRLHNMRTLQYKSVYKQKENAIETLELFVPLAYSIGAYRIKNELEDLSFQYLKPDKYKEIKEVKERVENGSKDSLIQMLYNIKGLLEQEQIKNCINLRTKNIYGIYKRLEHNETIFENVKHIDEYGNEYWYARELKNILDYKEWRKFEGVIEKAKEACINSEYNIEDHFVGVDKMVKIGSKTERKIKDYKLSRYACYIIAQNGDSRKKIIALAQTYFAIQTRKQELTEKDYSMLTEDEKRFYQRSLTKKGNYSLNQAAKKAGVKNFDKFHNAGYKGLYNGETANDIAKRKGLRYREDILDNMGSEELAANLFRITQTESKLKRENISSENEANNTHYNIGKNIREVIAKNGGTMPEELPTPNKSLKELEKAHKNIDYQQKLSQKN